LEGGGRRGEGGEAIIFCWTTLKGEKKTLLDNWK